MGKKRHGDGKIKKLEIQTQSHSQPTENARPQKPLHMLSPTPKFPSPPPFPPPPLSPTPSLPHHTALPQNPLQQPLLHPHGAQHKWHIHDLLGALLPILVAGDARQRGEGVVPGAGAQVGGVEVEFRERAPVGGDEGCDLVRVHEEVLREEGEEVGESEGFQGVGRGAWAGERGAGGLEEVGCGERNGAGAFGGAEPAEGEVLEFGGEEVEVGV